MTRARFLTCVAAALVLSACARSAPDLPSDRSSVNAERQVSKIDFSAVDLALSCEAIAREQRGIRDKADAHNQSIRKHRGQNQAASYIAGVIFLPAILATESNEAEKAELDRLQQRHDDLVALRRVRDC